MKAWVDTGSGHGRVGQATDDTGARAALGKDRERAPDQSRAVAHGAEANPVLSFSRREPAPVILDQQPGMAGMAGDGNPRA